MVKNTPGGALTYLHLDSNVNIFWVHFAYSCQRCCRGAGNKNHCRLKIEVNTVCLLSDNIIVLLIILAPPLTPPLPQTPPPTNVQLSKMNDVTLSKQQRAIKRCDRVFTGGEAQDTETTMSTK